MKRIDLIRTIEKDGAVLLDMEVTMIGIKIQEQVFLKRYRVIEK